LVVRLYGLVRWLYGFIVWCDTILDHPRSSLPASNYHAFKLPRAASGRLKTLSPKPQAAQNPKP